MALRAALSSNRRRVERHSWIHEGNRIQAFTDVAVYKMEGTRVTSNIRAGAWPFCSRSRSRLITDPQPNHPPPSLWYPIVSTYPSLPEILISLISVAFATRRRRRL